jgi:diketogulonate reductase-like aldo/keto reductase
LNRPWHRTEHSERSSKKALHAIGAANFRVGALKDPHRAHLRGAGAAQVELHPFFIQPDLHETNASHGIVTQSWSALGNSVRRASGTVKDRSRTQPPSRWLRSTARASMPNLAKTGSRPRERILAAPSD